MMMSKQQLSTFDRGCYSASQFQEWSADQEPFQRVRSKFEKPMTHLPSQFALRTSATMRVLFGGILGLPFLLGVFVALTKVPAFWFPSAIMGGVLGTFLLWMATTSLTLASDCIHYRSLFVTKDVPLSDIVKAKFVAGFSRLKPHQRLVITVRETHGEGEITINVGLFDRAEIRQWVDTLNLRLTQLQVPA